jgi:hypothetical protein
MFQTGVTVHGGATTTSNILSGTVVESSGNQGNLKIGVKSASGDIATSTWSATCGNTVVADNSVPVDLAGNYPQYQVNMRVPANTNLIFNYTSTAADTIYWVIETS